MKTIFDPLVSKAMPMRWSSTLRLCFVPCCVLGLMGTLQGAAHAAVFTFNGTNNGDLENPSNYTNNAVPADDITTDTITVIAAPTNQPVLTKSRSIAGITFSNTTGAASLSGASTLTIGANGVNNSTLSTGTTTVSSNIALGAGTTTPQIWTIGGTTGRFLMNGVLDYSTSRLQKVGNGILVLNGANTGAGFALLIGSSTYTNTIRIDAGTVEVGSASAFGTSTGTTTSGVVDIRGATLRANKSLTLPNIFVNATASPTIAGTSNIELSGGYILSSGANSQTLTVSNTGMTTLSGPVSLTDLTADTTQTLTVSVAATAGNTTISGVVQNLAGGGVATNPQGFTLGAGTLNLTNTNTYTGGTTIGTTSGSAVIRASATQALGTGTVLIAGNTSTNALELSGGISLNNAITLNGRANFDNSVIRNTSGNNTLSGLFTLSSGGTKYVIQSALGTLALTNTGPTTFIDTSRGLSFQGAGNISFAGALSVVTAAGTGGTVDKLGTGTLTLSGASTYTGATTVSAGTLLVNGSLTSATTVASGATLGGNGTLGAVTVAADGTHAPGAANGGTAIENTGDYANSGTLIADISGAAAGTGYDQVNVTGTVTLGGKLQVTLAGFLPATGGSFILINNDGTDAVASTFSGLPQGALVNSADGRATFTISYTGGTGNDVTLTNSSVRGAGTSAVLISQFRLSGPSGATDEFIELYNNTNAPLNVNGWSVQGSLAVTTANATPAALSIPLTGTLPPRGHLLVTNSGGYSLGMVYGAGLSNSPTPLATGDVVYGATGATAGADFALGSVLSVVNAQNTTVDTVNNGGALAPDAARIGEQYALVRRFETGLPTGGDSNFNLVSLGQTATNSDGTGTAPFVNTGRLGAPGPRNSQSPVQNNNQAPLTNPAGIANQTAKYVSSSGNYNSAAAALSPGGQISIRRTVTNNKAVTATKLRFRLAALTAGTSPTSGVADLRAISSKAALLNITGVTVNGLTLESPSDQTGTGGGLNSSWVTVDLISNPLTLTDNTTATGGLPAGKAANFEFLFGITAPGNYKAVVDVELLP